MGSVCAEQEHHKFHHSHQLHLNKKILREIDIPPRKLLGRRAGAFHLDSDLFMDSPKIEEALLHQFLPCNNNVDVDDDDEDSDDPYSSEHFRMYEFKVRKCTRSRSHDWTDCPFAHLDEKARRRDPRRYHYSGTLCPEFRRGNCTRGDNCEFAHGVFECWLHPSRYRTEACKDGKNCKRKICFFAHSPRQLRVVPGSCHKNPPSPLKSPAFLEKKNKNTNQCCVCCHSVVASPTSTLMGISHLSPPMSPSPPLSPAKIFSSVSRFTDPSGNMDPGGFHLQFNCGGINYKDAVTELMTSLEAMQLNHEPTSPFMRAGNNLPWVDVNFNGEDHHNQFILSPSNPSPGGTSKFLGDGGISSSNNSVEENENNLAGPDLEWVNDLLT